MNEFSVVHFGFHNQSLIQISGAQPISSCKLWQTYSVNLIFKLGVYHFYDNNFDISGIVLLSRMIEYSKNGKKKNVSIVKHCGKAVWNDCIAAVEQIWNPTRFEGMVMYFIYWSSIFSNNS